MKKGENLFSCPCLIFIPTDTNWLSLFTASLCMFSGECEICMRCPFQAGNSILIGCGQRGGSLRCWNALVSRDSTSVTNIQRVQTDKTHTHEIWKYTNRHTSTQMKKPGIRRHVLTHTNKATGQRRNKGTNQWNGMRVGGRESERKG